jgi:hypothetical protein
MAFPGFEQIPPAIGAGVAGGITGALAMQGTLLERIAAGVVGSFCAAFVAPAFSPFVAAGFEALDKLLLGNVITVDEIKVASFTGFLFGVAGMAIMTGVQRIARAGTRRAEKLIDDSKK